VITLYYFEGLRFGEIGRVLRVSESRISQIHSEVLRNLRMQLGHVH
jgi:RNA polymerase sigma factor for flagellar operon FliA